MVDFSSSSSKYVGQSCIDDVSPSRHLMPIHYSTPCLKDFSALKASLLSVEHGSTIEV